MPKLLGPHQIAECQRSGVKCYASELVRDGRNPHLLVLPRYADPAHPQEKPFRPDSAEGRPRFPVAPDNGGDTPPVLSLPSGSSLHSAILTAGFENPFTGWADASVPDVGAIGALEPQTLLGADIVLLAHVPVAGGTYIIGIDSGGESPPAESSLPDISFEDNLGAVNLSLDLDYEFSTNGSQAFWGFSYPGTGRLTSGQTYVIEQSGDNARYPALSWTEAETIGPRVEVYRVYRAAGPVAFVLQAELEVEFGSAPDYAEAHPTSYADGTAEVGETYRYRVDAITDDARVLQSNVVQVTIPEPETPVDGLRLLEDSEFRLLEDGSFRLLEV